MIAVDVEYNTQVRQRFATSCLSVRQRIITLQAQNDQVSLRLLAAIEKGAAFRQKWLMTLSHYQVEQDTTSP